LRRFSSCVNARKKLSTQFRILFCKTFAFPSSQQPGRFVLTSGRFYFQRRIFMRIKSIIVAISMAAVLPLTAAANKDKSEDLIKALKLDDNRAQQVERIMDDYEDQHEQLKEQKKDRLDEVLTDDEMDRLEAMKKAKKKKYKDRN
jgi:hypothetical protein